MVNNLHLLYSYQYFNNLIIISSSPKFLQTTKLIFHSILYESVITSANRFKEIYYISFIQLTNFIIYIIEILIFIIVVYYLPWTILVFCSFSVDGFLMRLLSSNMKKYKSDKTIFYVYRHSSSLSLVERSRLGVGGELQRGRCVIFEFVPGIWPCGRH